MIDTAVEPRQPSLLEKKANMLDNHVSAEIRERKLEAIAACANP